MASNLEQMAATIRDRSKTLINNDLKKILKEEGHSQSGTKIVLQSRVSQVIQTAVHNNDAEALRRLQYRVQHHGENPPESFGTPIFQQPLPPPPPANGYLVGNSYQQNGSYSSYQNQHQQPAPSRPTYFFKESPFLQVRELVMSNISLEASPSHRQSMTKILALSDTLCGRLKEDPTLRLLLFSALEQPLAPFTRLDITFPSQIEVRINGEEVKANYKGLKNKPGSTRPVDITDFVKIAPANHRNTLLVTYALTQKESPRQIHNPSTSTHSHELTDVQKYNLFVYMVKKFSVEELVKRIKQRNVITKQSVLSEMLKKANDPDIEVGSSVMSLKDPISTLRISTPCRSTICTHNQCFDAASFLQLQEQAPTFTCPICNKTISYEGLAVDEYVEEILNNARNADQVTIEPSGEWSTEKDTPQKRNGYSAHDEDESDDEIQEISGFRVRSIKNESAPTPTSLSTPPLPSRDSSTAPRSGNKRTSEVVDLTLSDDDEPPRPTKKVAYGTPNSLSEPRWSHMPHSIYSGNPNSVTHGRPPPPPPAPHSYQGLSGIRPEYSQSSTPSPRVGYASHRPIPPPPRPTYPGHGTSSYPTYLGSSP